MTADLKQEIDSKGFAIIEGLLDDATLQTLIADYEALLERLAPQWQAQGRISSTYAGLPFAQRLSAVLGDSSEDLFSYFDIALPNSEVKADAPIHLSRAVYDLLRNEALLDAVESVIGGEILASPIQHARIKPPQSVVDGQPSMLVKETRWHQDQGVLRPNADNTEILTVWLAITDATVENGCLQALPYSHLDGITEHCPFDQIEIPDQLLAGEPIPLPIKAGDAIFMHSLTQHASLPNRSDSIRWSFDLRYQPIGLPTGRDEFPGLIVRSRRDSSQVQSYDEWRAAWYAARDRLAAQTERQRTHRWNGDAPLCA